MDLTHKETAPASDGESARLPESACPVEPAKYISPPVAHELNNILAIVQGYAGRLVLKYADDATLTSELKLITDAARRAALIIRNVTPQTLTQSIRQIPRQQPEPEHSIA